MRATRTTFIPATLFAAALVLSGCVTLRSRACRHRCGAGGVTAAAFNGSIGTGILIGAAGGALCDDAGLC